MTLQMTVAGEGPDLVLLHGWGMPAGVWRATAQALSACFRVHCVDLPGYNASQPPTLYTPDQLVADLSAALPPAIVCGWSLGGQLALQWAQQAPQQVQRLILVATTPCFTQRPDWPHGVGPAALHESAQGVAADPAAFLLELAGWIAHGDENERHVVRQLREALTTTCLPQADALQSGLRWLAETDLRGQLATVKQPALVIHGDCDTIAPAGAGAALAAALPQARFLLERGVAHAPFLSRPREFVRQVMEFCDA